MGIVGNSPIEIVPSDSKSVVCLQVVDYFLWALQRLYEREEDRFLNPIGAKLGLIHEFDDTRSSGAGVFYSQSNPLTVEKREKNSRRI
jgi:hypothetical protein